MLISLTGCGIFKSSGGDVQSPPEKQQSNETPPENKVTEHHPKDKKDTVKSPIDVVKKRMDDSLEKIYPITVKSSYTMSVFLPLYLNETETDNVQKSSISISMDFYKGLLMAADTLKYCGKDIKIRIYDSESPFLNKYNILDTIEQTKPDLIIGPLLERTRLTYLDTISKRNKINWVSPLQAMDKCMGSNYYFESLPSNELTGKLTAEAIMKEYPEYRIIIISENTLRDNPIAKAFYDAFPNKDSVKIVNYLGKPASTYDPGFTLSDKNIVFIPSKNETFVSGVFSKLRINSNPIIVYGIYPWIYFRTQEGDLWEKFNVHISTPFHIDYNDPELSNFITAYRTRFREEPSIWSFIGFDEVTYYGSLLGKYGRYFQRYLLNNQSTKMLHSSYNLLPDARCESWKNQYINIIKFQGYEMVRDSLDRY